MTERVLGCYSIDMAMPETLFDDADEALEDEAVARARAEIADGKGVAHEAAAAWLRRLAAGERALPPIPD